MKSYGLDVLLISEGEKSNEDQPRFKKVQRTEYDLACPWCSAVMREKGGDFKFKGNGLWVHDCCDKPFRNTEEQDKDVEKFKKAFPSTVKEDDSKPTPADQKKVQTILGDKSLPDTAESGKAYIIHWADGRGIFAVKTKKAIKDWLEKTGSWAEIVSIKYGKPEHKGKKLRVEDVIQDLPILSEAQFQVNSDNLDKTYNAFKETYEKRTGKAWDKAKFQSRAGGWTFYGDHDGFVSARQQASGPIKLVGSAGNLQGVKKGFQELLAAGKPVWGMMDDKLAALSTRFGMLRPSPWVMKMVFKRIMPKVAPALGVPADKVVINADGSLTIDYPDVGKATKFLVGNKEYFDWMLRTHGDAIPGFLRTAIAHFLVTGVHPSRPVDAQED